MPVPWLGVSVADQISAFPVIGIGGHEGAQQDEDDYDGEHGAVEHGGRTESRGGAGHFSAHA